ncbi:MAG: dTMP kinase [Chloroflexi bacterium]|nr:dTMP kinase [Chloroflexota bacterium]
MNANLVPAPRPGLFICLEGPDGCGKTSQATRLAAALAAAGISVRLVREPGGTATGERVRAILLDRSAGSVAHDARTDALLFCAARAQLVVEVIRPALARGETVVAARFADSTLAYQGFGSGLALDELLPVERFTIGPTRPDLTVVLDLAPEAGLARKSAAETTRFEADFDLAYHTRVRAGYLALVAADPGRYAVIDADRPEDAVFADVLATVATRLPAIGRNLAAGT